jgi:hypothetical protein
MMICCCHFLAWRAATPSGLKRRSGLNASGNASWNPDRQRGNSASAPIVRLDDGGLSDWSYLPHRRGWILVVKEC